MTSSSPVHGNSLNICLCFKCHLHNILCLERSRWSQSNKNVNLCNAIEDEFHSLFNSFIYLIKWWNRYHLLKGFLMFLVLYGNVFPSNFEHKCRAHQNSRKVHTPSRQVSFTCIWVSILTTWLLGSRTLLAASWLFLYVL